MFLKFTEKLGSWRWRRH